MSDSHYDAETIATVNELMVKFVPELASTYAKWPMAREHWYDTKQEDPEGKPIFISGDDEGKKDDYVYCSKGPAGVGYYHLLNRTAYINLDNRMKSEQPSVGCCSKAAKQNFKDFKEVKTIVYNRSISNVPNDEEAAKDGHPGKYTVWSSQAQK